jgi:hypothetical protein
MITMMVVALLAFVFGASLGVLVLAVAAAGRRTEW